MTNTIATTDRKETIRALIFSLAQALVDDVASVTVTLTQEDQDGMTFLLRVAPGDLGKIIGRQGRMVRSLRTILHAASDKHRHSFSLNIGADA